MNPCWLPFSEVLWHSHQDNFIRNAEDIQYYILFQRYALKHTVVSPRSQWVNLNGWLLKSCNSSTQAKALHYICPSLLMMTEWNLPLKFFFFLQKSNIWYSVDLWIADKFSRPILNTAARKMQIQGASSRLSSICDYTYNLKTKLYFVMKSCMLYVKFIHPCWRRYNSH